MKFDELGEFNINLIIDERYKRIYHKADFSIKKVIASNFIQAYNLFVPEMNKATPLELMAHLGVMAIVADMVRDLVKDQLTICGELPDVCKR